MVEPFDSTVEIPGVTARAAIPRNSPKSFHIKHFYANTRRPAGWLAD
jgi:hypothetical protein